jgi:DNA polymerase III subunit beta
MKFSCTQENLNQILNSVSHIASKNINLPILSNILIKSENKNLTISATNLEIGIIANVRAKIDEEGEFSVDAKLFNSYISLLPKDRIDFQLSDDNLKIECQKQKTKIKCQSSSDFPVIPRIEKEISYVVSAVEFKKAIYNVLFAVSNSEIRPEISGVYLNFLKDQLILTATDSYRLAEKKLNYLSNNKIKNNEFEAESIIIPSKTLQEVSRLLSSFKDEISMETGDNLEIYLEENQIMFSYNGIELVSRLIDGSYPDYKQIIPASCTTKITINIIELIKSVKTASLFVKSGVFDVKLDFKSNQDELLVTSSSSQTGENTSSVDMKKDGQGDEIILNYKYLLDGLQNMDSEEIIFEITDSNNPCLIKPANNESYLYLIMPIRQ